MNYTKEQLHFLRAGYKKMPCRALTAAFNKRFRKKQSVDTIKGTLTRNGFLCGRTGLFDKGNKPWNTGTKGLCKPSSSSFKKGDTPKNQKPLGHERICSKDGYILVKVAERNPYTRHKTRYRFKQHVVWEQHYGKVPKGHALLFLDGNKLNCSIKNLTMITQAENLRLNQLGYMNAPAYIKPSLLAIAKVQVKTFSLMNARKQKPN
jgi:hypothetical protein